MFDNIGEKLKKLAWFFFIVAVIGSVVGAIMLFSYVDNRGEHPYIVWCIVALIAGVFSGWVGAALLYAFGELVNNSSECVNQNGKILNLMEKDGNSERPNGTKSVYGTSVGPSPWKCRNCGTENPDSGYACRVCGRGQINISNYSESL